MPPDPAPKDLPKAFETFRLVVPEFTGEIEGLTTDEWWTTARSKVQAITPNSEETIWVSLFLAHLPEKIATEALSLEVETLEALHGIIVEHFPEERWVTEFQTRLQNGTLIKGKDPNQARKVAKKAYSRLGLTSHVAASIMKLIVIEFAEDYRTANIDIPDVWNTITRDFEPELNKFIDQVKQIRLKRSQLDTFCPRQADPTKAYASEIRESKAALALQAKQIAALTLSVEKLTATVSTLNGLVRKKAETPPKAPKA
ncbi:hypothetical protein LPJ59_003845 [Coemansia sp. RSA 2399]|nr:hypothetical protein LPJ59_003845 [Coemansia sp. RSA 2399]KAJ1902606.1 hypothetical protein LPJ81_003514 [Coemansia sp. IMI 209127]